MVLKLVEVTGVEALAFEALSSQLAYPTLPYPLVAELSVPSAYGYRQD